MALGADRGKMMELLLAGAFTRVVIGLILGLPLAIEAGKLLSAQLFVVGSAGTDGGHRFASLVLACSSGDSCEPGRVDFADEGSSS